jgi:hypothetical protein
VKKLIEGLPFYQDKLHEETVFNRFNEILTKVGARAVCLVCDVSYDLSVHEGAGKQILE